LEGATDFVVEVNRARQWIRAGPSIQDQDVVAA
jgi:hypothetical protein